jgi:hypothetical protein
MDWLGFTVEGVYIWLSSNLTGRQLLLATLVTHCVCVQHAQAVPGVEHAHLMCVLLVCLCEPDPVNLALERISSAD